MLTTIIGIIIIAFLVYLFIPSKEIVVNGKLTDLAKQFNVYLFSDPPLSSLIIAIKGKEDFIQFSRASMEVELDYPLITERQNENRNKYREICSELGLELRETKGSDGSAFLDADVPADPEKLAKITKRILGSLFGATDETKLKYSFIP